MVLQVTRENAAQRRYAAPLGDRRLLIPGRIFATRFFSMLFPDEMDLSSPASAGPFAVENARTAHGLQYNGPGQRLRNNIDHGPNGIRQKPPDIMALCAAAAPIIRVTPAKFVGAVVVPGLDQETDNRQSLNNCGGAALTPTERTPPAIGWYHSCHNHFSFVLFLRAPT